MPTKMFASNVARDNWREMLDTAMASDADVVITRYGKPVVALVSYEDFLAVQDALADIQMERRAAAAYQEWKDDPSTAIPWEDFKAELIEEGLLNGPADEAGESPHTILEVAASVYVGLSGEEIDEIERIALGDSDTSYNDN